MPAPQEIFRLYHLLHYRLWDYELLGNELFCIKKDLLLITHHSFLLTVSSQY